MDVQIALEGEGKDNYKIKDGAKTLNVPCEITPKIVSLVWSGNTGLKFGAPVNVTATVDNAVSDEEVAVTVEGGKDGSVGKHTATATGLTIAGESAGNYQLPDVKTQDYTVEKAETVSGVAATFEVMYNDTAAKIVSINSFTGLPENIGNPQITENITDKQDNDSILSADPTATGFALKADLTEAKKDSTATWNVTISSDTHEDITATVTVKVIAKKQLTISGVKMAADSYTYGGAAVTYDKSALAVVGAEAEFNNDTLEYIYAGTPNDGSSFEAGTTAPTKAGSYTLTVKVPNSDQNYVGQQVINFTIAKKSIAKPAQAEAVVYNGKAQTYAVVSTNEYTVTSAAQTNANTEGYDVTIALADKDNTMWDDNTTDNLTQKFIIKKAPKIVVAASAKNIYVNGQVPVLTSPVVDKDYTVAGLLGSDKLGETITLAYQKDGKGATPDNRVVGTYDIVISGATAPAGDNYEGIEFKNATLTIASQPSSGSSGGSYYPYTPSTPSKPAAPNLDKTKTDSTTALNAAATANKYDAAEQAEVKKILDKANADIKNAKTEAEVKAIEEAAQAEIDKILTTEEKAIVAALDNVEKRDFATKSKVITRKGGKKVIRLTWTAPDGVDVDGYEIFRSTKKNSGFGKKPYFTTSNTSYTNTKDLKAGKTYYYKVRAFVVINGERVYTDYSLKANRKL